MSFIIFFVFFSLLFLPVMASLQNKRNIIIPTR